MIGRLAVSINHAHNHESEHHKQESVLGSILPGFLMPKAFQRVPHEDTCDSAGTSGV
jgi:hypothetical protein